MKIIVTGGASFIGSHLVERLVESGQDYVIVLDDMSSGSWDNLQSVKHLPNLDVRVVDLRTGSPLRLAPHFLGADLVYHLAADHGGRGYVETRQVATSNNFALDNNVFQACILTGIGKVVFASSGCVYPTHVTLPSLKESDVLVDGAYNPDGLYGLAKLAGELTLQRMKIEHGIDSVSCRFFTVFGPCAKENHAIISFIARAFSKQSEWVVWGDGHQVRDWTYVDDIVAGLLYARRMEGCQVLNLGTPEPITVDQAIELVLESIRTREGYHDYEPRILHDPTKPVGPKYRVGDSGKYLQLSGNSFTPFREGLARTIEWYWQTHDQAKVAKDLDRLLIDRK